LFDEGDALIDNLFVVLRRRLNSPQMRICYWETTRDHSNGDR
jgi:hypothetical protein